MFTQNFTIPLHYIKGPLSSLTQFLTTENPFKMMKNAFYSMLKALFVPEIFTFLSWLFDYVEKHLDKNLSLTSEFMTWQTVKRINTIHIYIAENGLLRKLRLISKFMMSQTGQQRITMNKLPNISRRQSGNEIWSVNIT